MGQHLRDEIVKMAKANAESEARLRAGRGELDSAATGLLDAEQDAQREEATVVGLEKDALGDFAAGVRSVANGEGTLGSKCGVIVTTSFVPSTKAVEEENMLERKYLLQMILFREKNIICGYLLFVFNSLKSQVYCF